MEIVRPPKAGAVVCVSAYENGAFGPPLAVGHMLVNADDIFQGKIKKGKAVSILHVYKDYLWSLGSNAEPPAEAGFRYKRTGNEEAAPVEGGGKIEPVESEGENEPGGEPTSEQPSQAGGSSLDTGAPANSETLDDRQVEEKGETLTAEGTSRSG